MERGRGRSWGKVEEYKVTGLDRKQGDAQRFLVGWGRGEPEMEASFSGGLNLEYPEMGDRTGVRRSG